MFQSPSLRGSGRFAWRAAVVADARAHVSIPFIAGQWSLPLSGPSGSRTSWTVSIPFIAGQWSLLRRGKEEIMTTMIKFQSPSLRGSGRF